MNFWSQDRTRGIAMGYGLAGLGSIPGSVRFFSLLHTIQTSSGAHPAFYPVGTGGYLPQGKVAGA
jgi:hypothetical protein